MVDRCVGWMIGLAVLELTTFGFTTIGRAAESNVTPHPTHNRDEAPCKHRSVHETSEKPRNHSIK